MAVTTLIAAVIACLPLPALFTIALFAIQIMVQLAVPLYLGIFTRLGNKQGPSRGCWPASATVCVLQISVAPRHPVGLGLTTGAVGLIVNLAVFLLLGVLVPRSAEEQARLAALFETEDENRGKLQRPFA